MAKDYAKQFYQSAQWRKTRDAYADSVYWLCERCYKNKGLIHQGDIVHHIVHITPENIDDPNVTLNWDNLEFVCREEHNRIHMKTHDDEVRDDVMFTADGDLVKRGG